MFFLSILNRNIEVYYTQMDKRKTHRTLDWKSGLWISTKFANLVKKNEHIYTDKKNAKKTVLFS